MVIDNVVEQRDVDTSGRQICYNEDSGFSRAEFRGVNLTSRRVQLREDEGVADLRGVEQQVQVLDVVTGRRENDYLAHGEEMKENKKYEIYSLGFFSMCKN